MTGYEHGFLEGMAAGALAAVVLLGLWGSREARGERPRLPPVPDSSAIRFIPRTGTVADWEREGWA